MNEKFFDLNKEKQDRMINAALKVFAKQGYRHASTDDIGLDLVAISFRFSHIQTFLLFFRCALW